MSSSSLFEGEFGKLVRMTGRETRYDVSLGDGGWESYPGIEHATREAAMDGIATAITELQHILSILAKEPAE